MIRTSFDGGEWSPAYGLGSSVSAAILAVIIVGALYYGHEVFEPMALAVLLGFVLAPLVRTLQRWRVPRGVAVVSVVLLAFLCIFALGSVIVTQITELAGDLPRYEFTMRQKIASLRGVTAAGGSLERAAGVLQDLGKELEKPAKDLSRPATGSGIPQESKPIPVELRQPPPSPLESVAALISPLLHPLTTTGIIIIFVIFVLLQREDLRNRLIKLAGSRDLQKTTAALDDAAKRLSRLFLTQLALNAAFGLVIGTGLWAIGVPSAVLWGILAAVLRFVPYIGAFISAVFPLALAAAVDPSWSMVLWTAGLFFVVEPTLGQVVEPLVYGHSTGLSPVAVVVSATFWTALWGPIGLVLATPLTVCLVVIGRHVERLRFLDVLLGDRPALSPPEIFYQRMLAGDPTEAAEKAEEFLKERSLTAYYDEVALKGLQLAQDDLDRGSLDRTRVEQITRSVSELVDDLDDEPDQEARQSSTQDPEAVAAVEAAPAGEVAELPVLTLDQLVPEWREGTPVLCMAGQSALDEAAGLILVQLLRKHGIAAQLAGFDGPIPAEGLAHVRLVCLSYFSSTTPAHMRYAIRRLRRKMPHASMVLGCWVTGVDPSKLSDAAKADSVVTSLREALKLCLQQARLPHATGEHPARRVCEVTAA